MKEELRMPLSIQMFAEEDEGSAANEIDTDADNIETTEDTSETVETEDEQTSTVKNSTKEYSERLNRDREKIRKEIEEEYKLKNDNLAKARGFENWAELEEASNREMLEGFGVNDTEGFNKYLENVIANNPAMLQAKAIIAEDQRKNAERQIQEDIVTISKIDPSITSIADLLAHPSYANIAKKVENGMNLVDAYKLENFEALTNKRSDAAVAHAMNNISNKSHMTTMNGRASTDVAVPSDVYAMYKTFNPNMTDEEIRKHYSNYGG